MRLCLAIALFMLGGIAPASAQECDEGRVRVEGVCCWPTQTFSAEHRRCEGAPQCPEGLVEHGESCIASVVPPPPSYEHFDAPPSMTTPDIGAPGPPRTTVGWPQTHEAPQLSRAVRRHGEDGGLVAAAMVVFDIGWTFGLLVGILDATSANCSAFSGGSGFGRGSVNCNTWALAFIPVGGGAGAGLFNFASAPSGSSFRSNATWGASFGSTSVVLQTAGLVMMAVALANEVNDFGMVPLGGGATLSLLPAAQASDLGVTGLVVF